MKCLYCGKEIPKEEAEKIKQADVEPFCSLYCCEMYSGVPLPYGPMDGWMTRLINEQESFFKKE